MAHDAAASVDSRDANDFLTTAAGLHADLLALEASLAPEVRFSFLQWLLNLPDGVDAADAARALLDHQRLHPHPALSDDMLALLRLTTGLAHSRLDHCRRPGRGRRANRTNAARASGMKDRSA
jgi:hypothetical protein